MNFPLYPSATLFVLAQITGPTDPVTVADRIAEYGLPALLLIALGSFTFWQEKQRNKREDAARIERTAESEKDRAEQKEQFALLAKELDRQTAANEKQAEWMRKQLDNSTNG